MFLHSKNKASRKGYKGEAKVLRKCFVSSLILLWLVLGIGLKNQNRLIGNSEQSIIDYNRFSACFVRKIEYSFLPNIITVVFR